MSHITVTLGGFKNTRIIKQGKITIYRKVIYLYGGKQIGKWVTPYKPEKSKKRIMFIAKILVNICPKTHQDSKMERFYLWVLALVTQNILLKQIERFLNGWKRSHRHDRM